MIAFNITTLWSIELKKKKKLNMNNLGDQVTETGKIYSPPSDKGKYRIALPIFLQIYLFKFRNAERNLEFTLLISKKHFLKICYI